MLYCTIARISIQIKSVARMARTSGVAIKITSTDDRTNLITDINVRAQRHINVYIVKGGKLKSYISLVWTLTITGIAIT